ncbi:ABC transporter permease family protein [Streptomyces harbinensis]|uniref:ABC transporter permease n=1 Tax=Streptomyces harbinensis TaxID=1176198 RepID=UPI0036CBADFA
MPSQNRKLITVLVALPLAVTFILWAFAWPAARTGPHDLPIGVAGPAEATAPVTAALQARDGAFDVHSYPDAAAAITAIENRDIYGALVPGPDGAELLTASAAGASVAQLLEQVAAQGLPEGAAPTVTDVVPAPASDPRGAVFGVSVLPMAMAGIALGALVTLLRLRGRYALAALAGTAAAVGTAGALIGHSWLGAMAGGWWTVAGALALLTLAGGATVAALAALLGPRGIGLGAVLLMMLGNPWSGATSAPEMLPAPVGTLGQLLPTGAGSTLLRGVSFFDGAGTAFPLAVLTCWAVAGLATVAVVHHRRPAPTRPAGGPPAGATAPAVAV